MHGGPLGLCILAEISAGHGCTVNAIAARLAANIDNWIANARCCGIEDLVLVSDAHGHRIDEDIAIIGRVEIGLARNCRHAHAIAIAANAGNHAFDQMLHLGVLWTAKP